MIRLAVCAFAALAAATTAARAEEAKGPPERPLLVTPASLAAARPLQSAAPAAPLFPRVSVDRRVENLTGSLGFLCGREPGHGERGSAATFGYDPHGRFLGARLAISF